MNEYEELCKNLRMAGRFVEQEDGSLETYLLTCGKCEEIADAIERLVADRNAARNELCEYCGKYKDAHLGACDGCKWRD